MTAWQDVAATGTDPALLAAVVGRAAAAPRDFVAARRAALRQHGATPDVVRALAAEPVVDVAPGERAAATWARLGLTVALAGDPAMPARLSRIGDPPTWLAMRGTPPVDTASVAVVGSRSASDYGRSVAAWLARALGQGRITIISGGAVGIDAAAHDAAADTPGSTVVVLGCGHDVAYPRPHAIRDGLFARVVATGGAIVSESLPHDPPKPWRVRDRNRIIAGMADAVVVVEGGPRSGSLVTANWAADQGLPVLAVPGDVRAPGSQAPLRLLRDGAGVCGEPGDVLAAIDELPGAPSSGPEGLARADLAAVMPGPVADVLVSQWPRGMTLSALARAADVPTGRLLAAITAAQVAGLVTHDPGSLRLTRRPA